MPVGPKPAPLHRIQVSLDVRTGVRPETQRLPQGHPDGNGVMPLQRLCRDVLARSSFPRHRAGWGASTAKSTTQAEQHASILLVKRVSRFKR